MSATCRACTRRAWGKLPGHCNVACHLFRISDRMTDTYARIDSPVGLLTIVASPDALRQLRFGNHPPEGGIEDAGHPVLAQTRRELGEYFNRQRERFDVPFVLDGTLFQRSVWALLTEIPYGETTSYGALAQKLGARNKARAVGIANGANPVAIIVPCHRVIGASGALTGFGGGLPVKDFLLRLESRHQDLFMPRGITRIGTTGSDP